MTATTKKTIERIRTFLSMIEIGIVRPTSSPLAKFHSVDVLAIVLRLRPATVFVRSNDLYGVDST